MPKKQLDASYMEWADGVPQEIVEKFLNSTAAEKIANLHGGMTRAQQRAQELEAAHAADQARYGELDAWATKHRHLYDRMSEWAPIIEKHGIEEVNRALSGEKTQIEQAALEVGAAYSAGDLPYEKAAGMVLELQKRYATVSGQVEEFTRFREKDVPQLIGAVQENFKASEARQDNSNRALLEYVTEAIDYARAYPTRPVRKIYDTFLEKNKEKNYKTFAEIASDAYGEDDTDQLIEQRAAEKLAARQKEQTTSQEAPISGSALGPYHRRQAPPVAPPPTTSAGVRSALMERFQKLG